LNQSVTGRQLRRQRREAERKARKLEYQKNRGAGSLAAAPAAQPGPPDEPALFSEAKTQNEPALLSEAKIQERSGPTGPRSREGKAISSGNSLKHGLASGRLIIPGEDPADFEALLNDLIAEHAPATETEYLLVQQMAQSWWLTQRAIRLQGQAFTETLEIDTRKLALFLRYQTTHERAFYKALNALSKLKQNRAREQAVSLGRKSDREFVSQRPLQPPSEPGFVSQNGPVEQTIAFCGLPSS
jgi:hypothetical protein